MSTGISGSADGCWRMWTAIMNMRSVLATASSTCPGANDPRGIRQIPMQAWLFSSLLAGIIVIIFNA